MTGLPPLVTVRADKIDRDVAEANGLRDAACRAGGGVAAPALCRARRNTAATRASSSASANGLVT